jgi:hypothetical protein
MSRTLGITASLINIACVAAFAICMPLNSLNGCFLSSVGIALSFVLLFSAYAVYAKPEKRAAANAAMLFAAMYAAVIVIVYFTQLTTVRLDTLSSEASRILDYSKFGLFFNLDLLGYALMGLATFFAGLMLNVQTKADKWLRALLLIHGVFFLICLIIPMLGIFGTAAAGGKAGSDMTGTILMEFWCAYFIPVGILSAKFFAKRENAV